MNAKNLKYALLCAVITFVMAYPIIGLRLVGEGTRIVIDGADPSTLMLIFAAVLLVFLFQLFREQILGAIRRVPVPSIPRPELSQSQRSRFETWGMVGLFIVAVIWPFVVSRGATDLSTLVLIYVLLGLGLNIVVGLAGLRDLGYVSF